MMNSHNSRIQLTNVVLCQVLASIFHICSKLNVQATLMLPVERTTGLGCIPEGRTVSYVCTVTDSINAGGTTIWKGGVFSDKCDAGIPLTHSAFFNNGGQASGMCGALTATIVHVNDSEYTSQLNLTGNADLNGATVICTLSGLNQEEFNDTISVGVLPSPPGQLSVTLSTDSFLNVSWSPPLHQSNINGYQFLVTGEDCGCASMNVSSDTTSIPCSGWNPDGQNCSFEVRTISEDCRFHSAPVNETLSLSVPSTPTIVKVHPEYNRDGSVQQIDVQFSAVEEPTIGANILEIVSYTVMIGSQSFPGVQCNTSNQQCNLRVPCSQLTEEGLLNVSVVASNEVGSGDPDIFPTPVATNIVSQRIARVTIDVIQSTVTCDLLSSYQETPNANCSISYGPNPKHCSLMFNSTTTTAIPNSSSILHLTRLNVTEYCYTVMLDYGSTVLSITGTFRSECNPEDLGTDPSSPRGAGSVTVLNGMINYNGLVPGSVATLVCDQGYSVANEFNRTCMSDGHWSEETLECIKDPPTVGCDQGCVIAIAVCVFGLMFIMAVFCVVMMALCLYKNRKVSSDGRVDWSSTFAGIEQPNEAYAPVLKKNIAYEQTKKPRGQRIDDSQVPAATEVEYESIEPVHEYEEVLPREKQVVQIDRH